MNYLEELPFDLQELIGQKVHRLYMADLREEIYEEALEYEWRKTDGMGDDYDEDYEPEDGSASSESDWSFTESE